jgi:hypothetical protein
MVYAVLLVIGRFVSSVTAESETPFTCSLCLLLLCITDDKVGKFNRFDFILAQTNGKKKT